MNHAVANGKVILFGEHAVVHGVDAIAAAISLVADVELDDGHGVRTLTEPDGRSWDFADTPLNTGFAAVLHALKLDPTQLDIVVKTQLPVAAGLGFSAAAAVALSRAALAKAGDMRNADEVFALSMRSEHAVHGNPSGMDNLIATYGKVRRYKRGQPPMDAREIDTPEPLRLVVAVSAERGATAQMVEEVARWKAREEVLSASVFADVQRIVDEAEAALRRGDIGTLGALMNQNHVHLQTMGVSTATLDLLCKAMVDAGAVGAKLTGGGGGGAVIALVETAAQQSVLVKVLQQMADSGAVSLRGIHRVMIAEDA